MIQQTITWSDLFAGLALALSCFATGMTLLFNRRQKSLIESQERLNNMLLLQGEREKLSAARADLAASFMKLGSSKYQLKIFNKGKATARNIRVELPEGEGVLIASEIKEKFPLESLEQHQSVELIAAPHLGSKLKPIVRLLWSDDASEHNAKTVYLTL